MKRPPGIWILLSAGVLWLSLQDVYGIRATALIFGKSTTTTTTPGPVANVTDGIDGEVVTEPSTESNGKNSTKPTLTGNPQLDYIHDANLPRELNGYNLSDYPFYERVPDPDEIDFKCDGLHDGFYASIPFKCQVYHHCLFGTRYDFLCANYTAFDQKTFICQFVSDVDCVGSKKFWHRNDALYKAVTTTTSKPLNIYTTAPPLNSAQEKGGGGQRAGGKRRRPFLRRPQYEYYDDYADYEEDYYEDRPRSNRRRRPRPRPRPLYDDEYDAEYEDDAYERRNRRPYNRRGSSGRRNKNRNKNREFPDDYSIEKPNERKKLVDDDEDDFRQNERRKPIRDSILDEERPTGKRKPQRYDNEEERPRKSTLVDDFEKDRPAERQKPLREDDFEDDYEVRRPSKKTRRPTPEDDYDEAPRNRPRNGNGDQTDVKSQEDKPLIVPTTGTIYDRPRVAPRIKPPVPKNEANKYAYKPIKATTPIALDDEEYYDDYEADVPTKPSRTRKPQSDPITPKSSEIKERKQSPVFARNRAKITVDDVPSSSRTKTVNDERTSISRIKPTLDDEDDALTLPPKKTNRGKDRYRNRSNTKLTEAIPRDEERKIIEERPNLSKPEKQNRNAANIKKYPDPDYYDNEYEFEKTKEEPEPNSSETPRKKWKPAESSTTARIPSKATTIRTTTPPPNRKERPEQIVRIVKRPFLPSRGGNPYVARGLQPVGFKAARREEDEPQRTDDVEEPSKESYRDGETQQTNTKPRYNSGNEPSGFEIREDPRTKLESNIRGEPTRKSKPRFNEPISADDGDFKPMKAPGRPSYDGNSYAGPRTTQKPKIPDRNPLDINEQEYDVTLNDALNPTLPNLPVKSNFPVGFSPANDYTFSAFQRPRYVIEPVLNHGNADYVYQTKQPVVRQQFETVPQSYSSRNEFLPNSNYYPQLVGNPAKRGVVQTQTQPYY